MVAQFEDVEGYFYFLLPFFEQLRQKTGQVIDLYDGAIFRGGDLAELKLVLAKAQELTNSQPDFWEILIGTQISPSHEEIFATVEKKELNDLLSNLQVAIEKAQSKNWCISFFGD